jgi:selenide,water dikinase
LRPLTESFRPADYPNLLVGLAGPDDAAVWRINDDVAVVQTLDFFPPVVDDPYTFGAVAAANAMSDVYAMGGEVVLALNIVGFPEDQPPEVLAEILRGGAEKVAEGGGVVAGGHTLYDKEPKYGLCVMGIVHPQRIFTRGAARPGDALLLTKALGTGITLTAAREDQITPEHLEATVQSMLVLNRHPSHLAREADVHAVTDVTGFGLLGHAGELAKLSGVALVLSAESVPALPGALEYARGGFLTGGASRNREALVDAVRVEDGVPPEIEDLLYDPQTSGGLLMAAPEGRSSWLEGRLKEDGFSCWRIGRVEKGAGISVRP